MKLKILTISILIMLLSCLDPSDKDRIKIPIPEKITVDKDITSIDFLPKEYQKFFYFKDSQSAYESFTTNDIYKTLKDNYLFLDLKYNYLENIDMFFTKFNFDFNRVFKYINGDTTFGIDNNSFFLIASMTWESKVFISLLNIAPESVIKESEYKNQKLYSVEKGYNSIHYAVVNNYVVFSDSLNGLKSCIISVSEANQDNNKFIKDVDKDELVYVSKINHKNNPFDLFPNMSEVKFKYNIISQSISYNAKPIDGFKEYVDKNDLLYHETLKYLDQNTALVLYNSSYDIKHILSSLIYDDDKTTFSNLIDSLDKRVGGVYFLVDDLEPLLTDSDPNLGFILNINSGEESLSQVKELTESILGLKWDNGLIEKDVTLYQAIDSSFTMVVSENNIGIFTNVELAKGFMNKTVTPQFSLYDKHKENFYEDNTYLDSFICYNPEEIKKSTEVLIKRYIFSSINMEEDEYTKSFGEILDLVSYLKTGYMNYMFDPESSEFYGSIKKLP